MKSTNSYDKVEVCDVIFNFLAPSKQRRVTDVDDWGKRRLAYEIQKMREGFYYFIHFEADGTCPAEVERRVRIMENVIRYLCVRQDA